MVITFSEVLCPFTQILNGDKQVSFLIPFSSKESLLLVYTFIDIISTRRIYLNFMWDDLSFHSPPSPPQDIIAFDACGHYNLGSGFPGLAHASGHPRPSCLAFSVVLTSSVFASLGFLLLTFNFINAF